jgi:uncharacterized protein
MNLGSELNRPLDDAELDRLSDLLDALADVKAMGLEEMDGFFSALQCAPEMPPMGQVIDTVLGGQGESASADDIAEVMTLTMRHWNAIGAGLARGIGSGPDDIHVPLLFEDEAGVLAGNDWARGFWRATLFDLDSWRAMMLEPDEAQALAAIVALAFEHDPDPARRVMTIEPHQREAFVLALTVGLLRAYSYFAPKRRAFAQATRAARTIVHDEPKVGRNDPCPCGSGRKYKRCHGAA